MNYLIFLFEVSCITLFINVKNVKNQNALRS